MITAPAKINLRLNVLAREDSGYHQLETVFCALELGDDVDIAIPVPDSARGDVAAPAPGRDGEITLTVAGADLGPPEQNLAYRAALAFFEAASLPAAAEIRLHKRVPAGAGLGGGSSDAAAVLRELNRLHGEPLSLDRLLQVAARLGADVPFFASGAALALAWGRGERLLPLPALPAAPVLLAVPPFSSATAEAYALLAEHRARSRDRGRSAGERPGGGAPAVVDLSRLRSWEAVAMDASNDFEAPLFARYPELAELRAGLDDTKPWFSLLSGSGSSIFAVYPDVESRDRATRELSGQFPGVRFLATSTAGVAA